MPPSSPACRASPALKPLPKANVLLAAAMDRRVVCCDLAADRVPPRSRGRWGRPSRQAPRPGRTTTGSTTSTSTPTASASPPAATTAASRSGSGARTSRSRTSRPTTTGSAPSRSRPTASCWPAPATTASSGSGTSGRPSPSPRSTPSGELPRRAGLVGRQQAAAQQRQRRQAARLGRRGAAARRARSTSTTAATSRTSRSTAASATPAASAAWRAAPTASWSRRSGLTSLHVLDLASGKEMLKQAGRGFGVAFDPGQQAAGLLAGEGPGRLGLRAEAAGPPHRRSTSSACSPCSSSTAASRLASGGCNGRVGMWDVSS